jgi:hypothetical protein
LNAIGKFFLRDQAEHVFLFVASVYAAGMIAFIHSISALSHQPFGTTTQQLPFRIFAAICNSFVFLWSWFLGTSLYNIAPLNIRKDKKSFNLALIVSLLDLSVLSIFAGNPRVMTATPPLAIIGTICELYVVLFVAKTLVRAETGKDPAASEYLLTVLTLCFLPFGILSLHPGSINSSPIKK